MKVLIIEDEYRLADLIRDFLEKESYQVEICTDGEDGYFLAASEIYDAVILDVMLPGMDGFSILKALRKENKEVPVLFLTAKSDVDSKVFGLDLGADDYLTKPFEMKELAARLRLITRRRQKLTGNSENFLLFGDLNLNKKEHTLSCKQNGKVMPLADKEYRLLEYLILNAGQVLSKEQISVRIWGYDSEIEYNSAEVYISFLRKKIAFLESQVKIITIRGVGYQIKEQE